MFEGLTIQWHQVYAELNGVLDIPKENLRKAFTEEPSTQNLFLRAAHYGDVKKARKEVCKVVAACILQKDGSKTLIVSLVTNLRVHFDALMTLCSDYGVYFRENDPRIPFIGGGFLYLDQDKELHIAGTSTSIGNPIPEELAKMMIEDLRKEFGI